MDYYDSIAQGYNELHKEEQLKKIAIIRKHLKPKGKLLDIGAGTGISTEPFLKECECYALDPSKEMLKQSKAQHNIVGSAEKLPFPDKFFDVIISLTALHLSDLKKSLAEIRRVSRDNAQIALTFLKKSKNKPKSLKGFKKIEEEKDIIFIKL
ncbi:MAG TPA: class I SAM-dependent methyltransferase [Candidatus Nanoarchaeia archaeon]|nr:class I SAM-dependent methyltransferase [Candidatus Nanoarchaeia archaeon]